jgi:proline dehydrogenase
MRSAGTYSGEDSPPSRERVQRFRIAVLCLTILFAASFASGEPEDAVQTQRAGSATREIPSDVVQEELTQAYLKEIITDLNAKLAVMKEKHLWQDGKWEIVLRNRLIDLSMWWKFADVTAWVLRTVGDDASVRKTFSFVMPFLNWMCEPFVFPVDTTLPEEQLEKEIDGLARFIALKREEGVAVSLDHVGDASLSEDDATQYFRFYIQLILQLAARDDIEEINLSLKLSALVFELDKLRDITDIHSAPSEAVRKKATEVKETLAKLLIEANEVKEKRVFVRIDMEEYAYKNATLAIFKEVVEQNPTMVKNADGTLRLGVVIQAYLRDAYKDLDDLMRWGRDNHLRVPVRLVKGAYEEYEKELSLQKGDSRSPVWNHKESTDASYEKLSEFLTLNKDYFQFAFATHNIRSIAHAMALASSCGIGKSEFEFQMLHGVGDEIKEVITTMGYRMRVYVPAGTYARGLKYAGRRFNELANKDNALSRTLRGDYSHLEGPAPGFKGPEDTSDGERVESLVAGARVRFSGEE